MSPHPSEYYDIKKRKWVPWEKRPWVWRCRDRLGIWIEVSLILLIFLGAMVLIGLSLEGC